MNAEIIAFAQIPEHPAYLDFKITIKKHKGSARIRKFSSYDKHLRFVLALVKLTFRKHFNLRSLMQAYLAFPAMNGEAIVPLNFNYILK